MALVVCGVCLTIALVGLRLQESSRLAWWGFWGWVIAGYMGAATFAQMGRRLMAEEKVAEKETHDATLR